MPVDNAIYDGPGDQWWDERQPLSALRTALNPARIGYFTGVLDSLGVEPVGMTAVDIGCGGGLFSEELCRLGARVIGVDPSAASLAIARSHADSSGMVIDYRSGRGEALPLPDSSVDVACCVDVLEHVADVDAVVRETARVLKNGGVYLFDTINRTVVSKLVMIKLLQDWRVTAWLPARLHAFEQFLTPAELQAIMARHQLTGGEVVGIGPGVNPARLLGLLWQLRRGTISPGELGRRARFVQIRNTRVAYAGYEIKTA